MSWGDDRTLPDGKREHASFDGFWQNAAEENKVNAVKSVLSRRDLGEWLGCTT
jgi:hypothetical protein